MPSSFETFIVENAEADIPRLLLSRVDWPVIDDPSLSEYDGKELAINTIESRRKLRDKVPEWFRIQSLVYPCALSAEQCGSSVTARYKADLAARILAGSAGRIADLTGGLGVDSWAFSAVASEVLYNERDPRLVAAARHNLPLLGADNVRFSGHEVSADSLGTVLAGFEPDIIYIDPARRSREGNKVFLLEDCSPDVLTLLPGALSLSRHILLKLSPMADISMVAERINRSYERHLEAVSDSGWNGNWVREIHVVSSGGECRELIVWIDREWTGEYSVTCREDGGTLIFGQSEISRAKPVFPESVYVRYLFEPGKSLSKAGVFNALCGRFALVKLARSTNLFTFSAEPPVILKPSPVIPSGVPVILSGAPVIPSGAPVILSGAPVILSEAKDLFRFGKIYRVEEVVRMNKAGMKDVGKRFPRSEVSARNIPLTSQELRARLGVKSGDDAHIFGVRIETPFKADNFLLVCHRI